MLPILGSECPPYCPFSLKKRRKIYSRLPPSASVALPPTSPPFPCLGPNDGATEDRSRHECIGKSKNFIARASRSLSRGRPKTKGRREGGAFQSRYTLPSLFSFPPLLPLRPFSIMLEVESISTTNLPPYPTAKFVHEPIIPASSQPYWSD